MVRTLAATEPKTRYTIVDITARGIVVYAADDDVEARIRMMAAFGDPAGEESRLFIMQHLKYEPMLRFTLSDPAGRTFRADRWCFRGSIDDWFPLEIGPLAELAAKLLPHVGSETFFNLM